MSGGGAIFIVLAGPYHYERMTTWFIQAVADFALTSAAIRADLWLLSCARLRQDDAIVHLLVTRGRRQFDRLLASLPRECWATILVIDSRKPETFREAKTVLETLRFYHLPFVLAATNPDHADAWTVDNLRAAFSLTDDEQVLPCPTGATEAAHHVLHTAIHMVALAG